MTALVVPDQPEASPPPPRRSPAVLSEADYLTSQTGSARRSNVDQMIDLFQSPALSGMAAALERPDRGRPTHYSARLMLAVSACARVTGSIASALTELQARGTWESCRRAFGDDHEAEQVPTSPPNRDHVRQFRKVLTSNPQMMAGLSRAFTEAAVYQAQEMGHLLPGSEPEWSHVDPTRAIFGDGTILRPYSDVVEVLDPATGELIMLHSRAKSPERAKIQREVRQYGADDKTISGINSVNLQTRTTSGPVVLALGSELGAEQWAALDLIDRIVEFAGDGVHTLTYDGALTGWHAEYLMASHRIQLLGKLPRRTSRGEEDYDFTLTEDLTKVIGPNGKALTARREQELKVEAVRDIIRYSKRLPIGLNIYEGSSSRAGGEVVYGQVHFLPTATHMSNDGATCQHNLVLDDGALYTAVNDDDLGQVVKDAYLRCVTSVPIRSQNGTWGRTSLYEVPCPEGDFVYEHHWWPKDTRHHSSSSTSVRAPTDPLGWRLRPIPRYDTERFKFVLALRNDAESYNAWFKETLPKKIGRAASPTRAGQELDYLLAAVLRNSNTWHNYTITYDFID